MRGIGPRVIRVDVGAAEWIGPDTFDVRLVGPRGGLVGFAVLDREALLALARDALAAAVTP